MFEYRAEMMLEMEANSADNDVLALVAIAVKYSLLLPIILWKECAVIAALYYFYPQLRGVLYAYTPLWFDDLSNKVVKTFSQDDHEPPPALEVDESVGLSRRNLWPAHGRGGGNTPLSSPISSGRFRQSNGTEIDADDWYVFDPVYGVIPITCRDLWTRQSREMEVRREASISKSRERGGVAVPAPPVRFAKDDSHRGPRARTASSGSVSKS